MSKAKTIVIDRSLEEDDYPVKSAPKKDEKKDKKPVKEKKGKK